MAVNDIYQIKLYSTLSTEDILNVFFYKVTAQVAELLANEIAQLFVDTVLTAIAAVQTSGVAYQRIEVVNLNTPEDFKILNSGEWDGPTNGTWEGAGGTASPFVNTTFRFERTALGQRYGYKRFTGVPEQAIGTRGVTDSTFLAACNACATALGVTLTLLGNTVVPVVAHRPIVYGTNPLTRLIPSALFRGIGSQNSRKPTLRPSDT